MTYQMTGPTPTISVVMAAYNGAALIEETLASLSRQTFTDFEVIVVDDRSTDTTREVVAAWPDPRVRLIEHEINGGPVLARNRAMADARGRYIAALDHDDICLPERFARQVAAMEADPSLVALGTATAVLRDGVVEPSRYPVATTPLFIRWSMLLGNPLVWSSMMIRGDAARALAPFSRNDRLFAEDFDMYHRLARMGPIGRLDTELLLYRNHGGSVSHRYYSTMMSSTQAVLAEAYAPLLGDGADAAAALVTRHWIDDIPCPDRATLSALADVVVRLQTQFLETHDCTREDRRLIRWHTARRWALVGRIALRRGALSLVDVLAVRPDHLGLGHAGVEELMLSQLVGGVRKITRRA